MANIDDIFWECQVTFLILSWMLHTLVGSKFYHYVLSWESNWQMRVRKLLGKQSQLQFTPVTIITWAVVSTSKCRVNHRIFSCYRKELKSYDRTCLEVLFTTNVAKTLTFPTFYTEDPLISRLKILTIIITHPLFLISL